MVPRLRIVLAGDIDGDEVVDTFIRLYAERPETAMSDRLFDLTGYQSGFDNRHLQRIAPAYKAANPDPRHPCRTAFVTRDPNFGLWAKAMGYQFDGRDLRAFSTLEEAESFLAEPLEERAPRAL
ncbi:MAG TPA: hypothetical protein VF699_04550 [Caulobacteraceae bacterium]